MRLLALTLLLAMTCGTPAVAENGLIDFPTLAAPATRSDRLAAATRRREIFDFPISKAVGVKSSLIDKHLAPLALFLTVDPEPSLNAFNGMMIAGE